MDNKRTDDLWKGGPWEQPSPGFTPPAPVQIPSARPILRPRRRRRRRWPWVLVTLLLIAALAASIPYLARHVRITVNGQEFPPFSSQGDRSDAPDFPYLPNFPDEERENISRPPAIPRAETGTGVTVELLPEGTEPLSYTQIYDKLLPSIVSIQVATLKGYAGGTGIVLTEDGYIVTNAHIVAGADEVLVIFHDNRSLTADLVGFHPEEDLAVLKVEANDLTPARFGDSSLLRCGDPVAAIGDSLGYRSTITDGIISSLEREVDVDGQTMTLIQASAATNYGSSGGALINQYGQVVGVTSIKIIANDGSAEAMSFSIPSRRMKFVVDALIDGRVVEPGMFGFTVLTQPSPGGGLELLEVEPDSDAWAKGLRPGDIITNADGKPVNDTLALTRAKQIREPGDIVPITYLRDGESHQTEVALIDATPAY